MINPKAKLIILSIILTAFANLVTFFGPNWVRLMNPAIKNMRSIPILGLPQSMSFVTTFFAFLALWYVIIRLIVDSSAVKKSSKQIKVIFTIIFVILCIFFVVSRNFVPFFIDCGGWPSPSSKFSTYEQVMAFFLKYDNSHFDFLPDW